MFAILIYHGDQLIKFRISNRYWLLLFTIMSLVVTTAATHAQSSETEVLTLHEAAILLRVSPEEVESLAIENMIPGRFIGREWRFSKTALLRWLTGEEKTYAGFLSKSELSRITGRGESASPDSSAHAPASDKKTETVGNKPDISTAEDVFLRKEKVLLKAKELSIELGLLYSYSDRTDFALSSVERETFTSSFGLRYGLADNLQLFASIPFMYQTDTTTSFDEQAREKKSRFGDVSLGLRRSVLQEGLGYPEIIVSIDGQIPTGKGSYGIGAGVALVKSLDPAVLFANFGYKYAFGRSYEDLTLLTPQNTFSASLGYAYALNDTLTLGTSVSGVFSGRTMFDNGVVLQSRKQFSLQFGLTSLIGKNLYIEPTVSFGLNRAVSDVSFGATLVYTFGTPSE